MVCASHICAEMFDETKAKSTLILTILKGNIGTLEEVNILLNKKQSKLFKKNILLDKTSSIHASPGLLGMFSSDKDDYKSKIIEYSPSSLYEELSKYVRGHEGAKQQFCIGVFEHLVRCHAMKRKKIKIKKNNILIAGPTGKGKTYMCQCMSRILSMPMLTFDATQYSETGYIGMSASDIISDTYQAVGGEGGKLKPCIIFIDGIDKLASRPGRYGETKGVVVQRELLKIIEGEGCVLNDSMSRDRAYFDVSNVLFVVAGAFSGIEKQKIH